MPNCNHIGQRLLHYAEGGVVEPPSRLQKLWDALMGKKALEQAAGQAPPSLPPPPDADTSIVRQAAEEAGRRMEAEKAMPKKGR